MDDWQDAAFSSRHMHNRVNRNGTKGGSGRSKRNTFDVRKSFGSYSCKCPAWHKLSSETDAGDEYAILELYRLTEDGQGVVGEILLPGVLKAAVILAASRKSLQKILTGLDEVEETENNADALKEGRDETTNPDQAGSSNEDESEDEPEPDRFETFEKNSFREPKFWLQWNGILSMGSMESKTKQDEAGLGYVIFTSNDCRKFKGTLNCASLGWKDVALSGHKIAPRSESDIPVTWGQDGVPI